MSEFAVTTYITACEYPHAEKSKKIAVFVVRDEFIVDFLFTKFYNYDSLFFTVALPQSTADVKIPHAAAPVCGRRKNIRTERNFSK